MLLACTACRAQPFKAYFREACDQKSKNISSGLLNIMVCRLKHVNTFCKTYTIYNPDFHKSKLSANCADGTIRSIYNYAFLDRYTTMHLYKVKSQNLKVSVSTI